jgi:radical SAM protein with 4Fe4S-binding SPASM domain
MSMTLYRKILDEAAGIPLITMVCITGLGEPTLDPYLVERVRYAREKKSEALIDVFTNGVYMTPEKFCAVRDAGISSVQFSLNAVRADQHEKIMGLKKKFDLVCRHIDYAIEHRGPTKVEVRAVINGQEFTQLDGYDFYERWGVRQDGGHGALITEGNWASDNRTIRSFDPKEACFRALSQIYVLWDGKVTTCCFDPVGTQVFGDLSKQTIREVYASEPYVAFREAHDQNRADLYDICKNCTRI